MNRFLWAVCLAASFGTSATRAQDAEDTNLRRAAAAMPADTLRPTSTSMAWFYDVTLLSELNDGQLDRKAFMQVPAASQLRPVAALAILGPDEWQAKTGVDPEKLRFFTEFGASPQQITQWGLADEAVATAAFDALPQHGFAPVEGAPDIVANGAPGKLDFALADPKDPWRGGMGHISAVARFGAGLLQATDPAVLGPAIDGPKMADSPFGMTLLRALEAQDGRVLQATFFGPHFGMMGGLDPTLGAAPDPQAAREAIQAAQDRLARGVPLYGGLAIADLVTADGPELVIAYAYADCDTAANAAATAATLWPESGQGMLEGTATPSHVDVAETGCAAVITVPGGAKGSQFNRAIGALMRRDLAAIHIASN